jgi:hypothetical protein
VLFPEQFFAIHFSPVERVVLSQFLVWLASGGQADREKHSDLHGTDPTALENPPYCIPPYSWPVRQEAALSWMQRLTTIIFKRQST